MFYDCCLAFLGLGPDVFFGEGRLATLVYTSHPPKSRKKRLGHYVRVHV